MVHEMDAMRCREWRIFPGMSLLNDEWGLRVFLLVHVPLFYLMIAGVATGGTAFVRGLSIFCLVHCGLHLLFLLHPKNEFTDRISWSIIVGAAMAGASELWVG